LSVLTFARAFILFARAFGNISTISLCARLKEKIHNVWSRTGVTLVSCLRPLLGLQGLFSRGGGKVTPVMCQSLLGIQGLLSRGGGKIPQVIRLKCIWGTRVTFPPPRKTNPSDRRVCAWFTRVTRVHLALLLDDVAMNAARYPQNRQAISSASPSDVAPNARRRRRRGERRQAMQSQGTSP
jgi:hypothetical protein